MALIHADDTNFEAKLKAAKGLVVVDFYADWCGPCQMFGPIFEEVSKEEKGVTFIKVNTENAPVISEKYGIMSIPRIFFMKNGKILETVPGAMSEDALKEKIKAHSGPVKKVSKPTGKKPKSAGRKSIHG